MERQVNSKLASKDYREVNEDYWYLNGLHLRPVIKPLHNDGPFVVSTAVIVLLESVWGSKIRFGGTGR